jgi:Ca2+-binding RTX toxin-like protein
MPLINGTPGPDQLHGTAQADEIHGGDGDDRLVGDAGDDLLFGEGGNDTLDGGDGSDTVSGGDGNDLVDDNGLGNDSLSGGAGNDELSINRPPTATPATWSVTLDGGDGDDRLLLNAEFETLSATILGGAGNDTVQGGGAITGSIDLGAGDDVFSLFGSALNVTLGPGHDTVQIAVFSGISTFKAPNILDFNPAEDKIDGGFADFLTSGLSNWNGANPFGDGHYRFVAEGAGSALQIDVNGGGDSYVDLLKFPNLALSQWAGAVIGGYLVSGGGLNVVTGGPGNDALTGSGDADTMSGLAGADTLDGGAGGDTIDGGEGDDVIIGGPGADRLTGYVGADLFVIHPGDSPAVQGQMDTITDWRFVGDDDHLAFSAKAATAASYMEARADTFAAAKAIADAAIAKGVIDYVAVAVGSDVIVFADTRDDNGSADDAVVLTNRSLDQISVTSIVGYAGPVPLPALPAGTKGTAGSDTLRGGDGPDTITDDLGGADQFFGGGGDDLLIVRRTEATSGTPGPIVLSGLDGNDTIATTGVGIVQLFGGLGNDQITVSGASSGVIDLGASNDLRDGNDTLTLVGGGGGLDVSLGPGGADVVHLDFSGFGLPVCTIHDFTPGDAGDVITFDNLSSVLAGWDGSSNPFAAGYLRLVEKGTSTIVQIDMDGPGANSAFQDLVTLQNTALSQLTLKNFNGLAVAGFPAPGTTFLTVAVTGPTTQAAGAVAVFNDTGYVLECVSTLAQTILSVAGSVTVHGGGEVDPVGIYADTANSHQTVVIEATGTVTVTSGLNLFSDDAWGYEAPRAGGANVVNRGAMTVSAQHLAQGIDTWDLDSVITNVGTLNVTGHDFAIGIRVHNSEHLVENDGLIQVHADTAGSGFGVGLLQSNSSQFINRGTILVTGQGGVGLEIDSGHEGALGYHNYGIIAADVAVHMAEYGPDPASRAFWNEKGAVLQGAYVGSFNPEALVNSGLIKGDVSLGGSNDYYHGEDGTVTGLVSGGDGNDTLAGGPASDSLQGNQGDDVENGGGGDDIVVGGKDNDQLFGDDGNDIVWGNLGNDTLDGGAGNDQVRGGQGDDTLTGGAGNDYVSGDRGNDTEAGGPGADIFHSFSGAGIDRVIDFNVGEGDRVMLDPGTTYSVSQVGADTVIDMGNGDQVILVGVSMSSLPAGTIFLG